jgi:hypothetical protein
VDDILRWAASVGTIGAGLILAARVRPRITGWAFVVLSGASIIWIVIGYLTARMSGTRSSQVRSSLAEPTGVRWPRGPARGGPRAFVSTIKLRQAGFTKTIDTEDSFRNALQSLIDHKLLPPATK